MMGISSVSAAHDGLHILATMDATLPIDLSLGVEDEAVAVNCGRTGPESHFTVHVAGGWFDFEEGSLNTSCGLLAVPVFPPPGAVTVAVVFDANRAVERDYQAVPLRRDAVQEVHALDGDGDLRFVARMADPESGSFDTRPFSVVVPLESDDRPITHVAWYLADNGQYLANSPPLDDDPVGEPPVGQELLNGSFVDENPVSTSFDSLSARYSSLRLHYSTVAAPALGLHEVGREAREDHMVVLYEGTWMRPDWTRGGTATLHLALPPELEFLWAGLGSLPWPEDQVSLEVTANSKDLSLFMSQQDDSPATLAFSARAPLPPAPLPSQPATFFELVAATMGIPGIFGVWAGVSAIRYRRQARFPYLGRAHALVLLAAVGGLAYLGLLYWLLVSGVARAMGTAPVVALGWTGYILIGLLMLLFASVLVLGSRQSLLSMRADLVQRERLARELERSNKELELFAYVASHDLQEPLRKVSSFTTMLQDRYGPEMDETANRFMAYAVDGSRRMQSLVRDLLHYSRAGSQAPMRATTDLKDVVDQVICDLEATLSERRARVVVGELPRVVVDAPRLAQAVSNLVANGIKYNQSAVPTVWLRAKQEPMHWRIEIEDNGIGVPADRRKQIFEPFKRLHTRTQYDGTGLGLAIAARIVERHGGAIGVTARPAASAALGGAALPDGGVPAGAEASSDGPGSIFWFTLPKET